MARKATCSTSCSSMKLDDAIKFAVLMRCVTGQLKTWLQLNVAETHDYSRLREAIIQYDSATLKWNNSMMLGQEVNKDGPVPMEIDRVMEKGRGGKAGKGKGKENVKGKGKGEQKGGKQGGKGKGQRKGQDHGVGSKSQQKGSWKQGGSKGSGKSPQAVRECFVCGKPGHLARDCWRKVRQVVDSHGSPSDTATTLTTSSCQATTTKQPGIKRVEFVEEEVSQNAREFDEVMIFGLSPNTSEGTVRMIKFYHSLGG